MKSHSPPILGQWSGYRTYLRLVNVGHRAWIRRPFGRFAQLVDQLSGQLRGEKRPAGPRADRAESLPGAPSRLEVTPNRGHGAGTHVLQGRRRQDHHAVIPGLLTTPRGGFLDQPAQRADVRQGESVGIS